MELCTFLATVRPLSLPAFLQYYRLSYISFSPTQLYIGVHSARQRLPPYGHDLAILRHFNFSLSTSLLSDCGSLAREGAAENPEYTQQDTYSAHANLFSILLQYSPFGPFLLHSSTIPFFCTGTGVLGPLFFFPSSLWAPNILGSYLTLRACVVHMAFGET